MHPLLLLLVAVAVVVGGVLVLRLHAVVALLAGAFLVALLTPRAAVYEQEIRREGLLIESFDPSNGCIQVRRSKGKAVVPGHQLVFRQTDQHARLECLGSTTLSVVRTPAGDEQLCLTPANADFAIRSGDLLLHHTALSAAEAIADQPFGERVARGFGDTCAKIGILIALAAIIGKCLLDSGAAARIVNTVRGWFGDRRAPLAFTVSGFVVGIPVFFDTVFYLLIPLGKAMRVRTGKDYLLYVLAIVVGASMAHSLVPPTPGPLFVAGELDVSIGLMMLGGIVVGSVAAAAGYAYAVWANRRWEIPLRELDESASGGEDHASQPTEAGLPPFWLAVLPIAIPVVLLASRTCIDMWQSGGAGADGSAAAADGLGRVWWFLSGPVVRNLGNANVALAIAAVVALGMLARVTGWRTAAMRAAVQNALASGGVIVLITASGGALGHVLRQTNVAAAIQSYLPATGTGLALLGLAFAVTAIVRAAQGSATVAMITAVGIVAPIAATTELPFHPLYLALAVGCGSKPLPWMNDSGFWIVGRMSGMTEAETLKTVTVAVTLMGLVGFLVTLVGALCLPLVGSVS